MGSWRVVGSVGCVVDCGKGAVPRVEYRKLLPFKVLQST